MFTSSVAVYGFADSNADENDSIEVSNNLEAQNEVNASDARIIASPLAKKIAAEKNIDLSTVQGSGDNGRIVKIKIIGPFTKTPKAIEIQ